MSDREFQALAETSVESRLGAAMRATAKAWAAAWSDSATGHATERLVRLLAGWSEAERIRCGAIAISAAALAHLGALAVVPVYVAPAVPRLAVAGVAIAAAAIAAVPEPFMRAWTDSRVASACRWLIESD